MFVLKFLFILLLIFPRASFAFDNYVSLLDKYCDLKSQKGNPECFKKAEGLLPLLIPLCQSDLQQKNCSQYRKEFTEKKLAMAVCEENKICANQDYITHQITLCSFGVAQKTFNAFIDLARLPLTLASLIDAGIANDKECFQDLDRKIQPVLLYNSFAPKELQIDQLYIKKDVSGKLIGSMKDWSCSEINRLVQQKNKKFHDYLADPKNKEKIGKAYFAEGGLLNAIQSRLSCLTPTARSVYICEAMTSLAANIAVGGALGKVAALKETKTLFLGSAREKFIVTGTRKIKFDFENMDSKAGLSTILQASEQTIRFSNGRQIKVIIPESGAAFQSESLLTVRMEKMIREMPEDMISSLDQIVIYPSRSKWDRQWAKDYNTPFFRSTAATDLSHETITVEIYPRGLIGDTTSALRHELGHVMSEKKYGTMDPPPVYLEAKAKDGNKVSNYGENSPAEDFAEAMKVYIDTDGGTKNPAKLEKFKNRFQEIDTLLKVPVGQRTEIMKIWKANLLKKRIEATTTGSGLLIINGAQGLVIDSN